MNSTTGSTGLVAGGVLQPAKQKDLPLVGAKILLMWNPYNGVTYEMNGGMSAVQEGQTVIEVEITAIKTVKVSFEEK